MKKIAAGLLISITLMTLLLIGIDQPVIKMIDLKMYDILMLLRKAPAQDPGIVYVEMDDAAIAAIGRWPWPRDIFADIVDTLASLKARQIIFDVSFAQRAQPVLNKEAASNIFQGEKQIREYIAESITIAKPQPSIPGEDVSWTLEQILKGFDQFTNASQKKLGDALTDTDILLADAFLKAPVLIGFNFETVTDANDIKKIHSHHDIQGKYMQWLALHPLDSFNSLPAGLKTSPHIPGLELQDRFLRAQLKQLMLNDPSISVERAATSLKTDLVKTRPLFYAVKKNWCTTSLTELFHEDPAVTINKASAILKVNEPETLQLLQESWPEAKNTFECTRKFGLPLPEKANVQSAISMTPPDALFTAAVKGAGFINGIPDTDGVLRRLPMFITYNGKIFPHIGLAALINLFNIKSWSFFSGEKIILLGTNPQGSPASISIPVNDKGEVLLNWAGPWIDTFQHISVTEIYRLSYLRRAILTPDLSQPEQSNRQSGLTDKTAELQHLISGKICIIGLTAAGTHDYNPVPYESAYPMLGTHGNFLNSALTGQFLRELPLSNEILFMFICAVLTGMILPLLPSLPAMLFAASALFAVFITAVALLNNGIVIHPAKALIVILFSYLGITSYRFATEEIAKNSIRNAFSKYVSPEIIADIIRDPSTLQLGGTRREMTVLFSDIRGFTTYSEKRSPEEVVSILNEYLDAMTRVIIEHKGTLDKYVGDAIMAIWGAPRAEPAAISAKRAVTTAVRMLEKLDELRAKWQREDKEPLDMGIGINTGTMVVGNMGSELRMDYTVIGDAVNLGARVEAQTRAFNVRLIITEATFQYVQDIVETRLLDTIKVKGKDRPVKIYAVDRLK